MSSATYQPKTRIAVKLRQQQLIDISQATGIPLRTVFQYADEILNNSVRDTILEIIPLIHKYAPKATGQLRNSLEHIIKQSSAGSYYGSGKIAQMKLGTYVSYMKYVANMTSKRLRHPKCLKERLRYKRNSKFGKKGSFRKNPGAWRYVSYYGAPRWVRLDDPKAQTNFFTLLVLHMQNKFRQKITEQIGQIVPKGSKRAFSTRMRPKK